MAITSRQFEQLSEMGINLWQKKSHKQANKVALNKGQLYDKPDLTELAKQVIFTDILLCLTLSIGEVSVQKDHLDVGLFNWYFSDTIDIQCIDKKLFTPNIAAIAQSSTLKKQLWHTLAGNLL